MFEWLCNDIYLYLILFPHTIHINTTDSSPVDFSIAWQLTYFVPIEM